MPAKKIAPAPKNLTPEENNLWFERKGIAALTPRGALMHVSFERFLVGCAKERIAELESLLKDTAEYCPEELEDLANDLIERPWL